MGTQTRNSRTRTQPLLPPFAAPYKLGDIFFPPPTPLEIEGREKTRVPRPSPPKSPNPSSGEVSLAASPSTLRTVRDGGDGALGDAEAGDLGVHGAVPHGLLHRRGGRRRAVPRRVGDLRAAAASPAAAARGARGGAAPAARAAGRGRRGGAPAVRRVRPQETPPHGHQGSDL